MQIARISRSLITRIGFQLTYQCSNNDQANFGYRKVDLNQKQEHVDRVFYSVAQKYDIMNDLMSFGIHRCWKDSFVEEIGNLQPQKIIDGEKTQIVPVRVLDVAGGTGDISFRILDQFYSNRNKYLNQPGIKVTVLDINQSMLDVGKQKSLEKGYTDKQIEFICANAEELPFDNDTFDIYTIAFGLRNVPRIEKALKEANRVLKRGGKFQCLEFSKVKNPLIAQLNNLYQFTFIPIMGQIVANDKDAYQYLIESIDKFLTQEELQEKVEQAGFKYSAYKNYTSGIVAVHSGFKL